MPCLIFPYEHDDFPQIVICLDFPIPYCLMFESTVRVHSSGRITQRLEHCRNYTLKVAQHKGRICLRHLNYLVRQERKKCVAKIEILETFCPSNFETSGFALGAPQSRQKLQPTVWNDVTDFQFGTKHTPILFSCKAPSPLLIPSKTLPQCNSWPIFVKWLSHIAVLVSTNRIMDKSSQIEKSHPLGGSPTMQFMSHHSFPGPIMKFDP